MLSNGASGISYATYTPKSILENCERGSFLASNYIHMASRGTLTCIDSILDEVHQNVYALLNAAPSTKASSKIPQKDLHFYRNVK